jgi:hypothetical protein
MKGLVRTSVHQPRYERVHPDVIARHERKEALDEKVAQSGSGGSSGRKSILMLAASERLLNLRVQERALKEKRDRLASEAKSLQAELLAAGVRNPDLLWCLVHFSTR